MLLKRHIVSGMSEEDGKNNLNVCVGREAEVRGDDEDAVVEEAGMGRDRDDVSGQEAEVRRDAVSGRATKRPAQTKTACGWHQRLARITLSSRALEKAVEDCNCTVLPS